MALVTCEGQRRNAIYELPLGLDTQKLASNSEPFVLPDVSCAGTSLHAGARKDLCETLGGNQTEVATPEIEEALEGSHR